ncbi:MAG: diguanylate cyclase, partial [Pseudomonadales bacterium]
MKTTSVIGIALLLLSATVSLFYYSEQMRTKAETSNNVIQANFRTLNLIHTSIEKDLLSLHANKIKNFDSITKSQSIQRTTLASLKNETKLLLENDYATIVDFFAEYQNSYEQTIPLIDTYKRNLAFTKNSLSYSTHLAGQILENLSGENNRVAKEKLNHLVADVLQYLINDTNHNEKVITKHIQELQAHLTNNNDPATAAFRTLSKHLKVVFHGNQTANSSLTKTLSSPHPRLLEASYKRYLEKQKPALKKHQLYSNFSIFSSLLLIIFILQTIFKLAANTGKLTQEKALLEESVTESKESLQRSNQKLKREIEQRVHAEDELKNSAILYQHCSEGVLICDKDKKTISVNPAFSAITGITAEEAIGHTPKIFDTTEIPKDIYDEMLLALRITGKWRGEVDTTSTHGQSPKEVSVISFKKQGHIYRYIVIIIDISERKKHEKTIYLQANYDPLTKLPNRNLFNERAEQTLARAQRNNSRFATLFIDLDNFKKINDNLGHSIGDELLTKLALRLSDAIRETDTVSRFGGDEFIIL